MKNPPPSLADTGRGRVRIYNAAIRLFAERGSDAVTVSDLASEAGIARGTIYNNIRDPEHLFGEVANRLSTEMIVRTEAAMDGLRDPVLRLATGVRLFVKRAHDEHDWGRFLVRFALAHSELQDLMRGPPARDIREAIASGRFKADSGCTPALVTMLNGSTLAAMNAVIQGEQTWRDAGSHTAEFFLRAGGLPRSEAARISRAALPELGPIPARRGSAGRRTADRARHPV